MKAPERESVPESILRWQLIFKLAAPVESFLITNAMAAGNWGRTTAGDGDGAGAWAGAGDRGNKCLIK